MATRKDWLTWEIEEEYVEDQLIGRMIGQLKILRETSCTLDKFTRSRLYKGPQGYVPYKKGEKQRLLEKELEISKQLAYLLKGLMTAIERTEEFERAYNEV